MIRSSFILFLSCFFILLINKVKGQSNILSIDNDTNIIKLINKYTPKDNLKNSTFILKFYKESSKICKFRITKTDPNKFRIDTFTFYNPFTKDSLFSKFGIKRVELIKSDSFEIDTPVVKSSLILPSFEDAIPTNNFLKDSLNSIKKLMSNNSIGITYVNEVEMGNNFYYGLTNTVNPRISNRINVEAKIMGIPMNLGTTYTNFRNDNSLNLSDFNFSFDVIKYKTELFNKNILSSKKLEKLSNLGSLTQLDISALDSEINILETNYSNPYNIEKYRENKRIEELNKLDSNYQKKIRKLKVNQINYDIEKYEKEKAKLDKLKELRELKKREFKYLNTDILTEKSDLLSGKNLRKNINKNSKIKLGFGWMYSINKLDLGRISPIYSDLTLNGLTYLGINTEFNLKKTDISLTIGRLNNYSSYLSNINNNLGGYIYGCKYTQNQQKTANFLSLIYYNPTISNNTESSNKYIVLGLGGKEQLSNTMYLNWELAYSETDSNNNNSQKNRQLFDKFDPYALAGSIGFIGDLDLKTKFELTSKYVGFDFKNPASLNLRNDFLRNSFKISRVFKENKIQITYQIKYDLDNFTSLKLSTTSILNNNLLFNYRINKNYKAILNLNHTRVVNILEKAQLGNDLFVFENKLVNASLIHSYKTKKVISTSILNLNFNKTETNANASGISILHQSSLNNLIDLYLIGCKLNSTFGYQRAESDTTIGINYLIEFSKNFKYIQLNLGCSYKHNNTLYYYKSINSGVGVKNKCINFIISLDYFISKDIFENQYRNNSGLILRTQLSIKI